MFWPLQKKWKARARKQKTERDLKAWGRNNERQTDRQLEKAARKRKINRK
jgi:hypothetical protein